MSDLAREAGASVERPGEPANIPAFPDSPAFRIAAGDSTLQLARYAAGLGSAYTESRVDDSKTLNGRTFAYDSDDPIKYCVV